MVNFIVLEIGRLRGNEQIMKNATYLLDLLLVGHEHKD